jgi:iron complex outermembrane receptor protein
MAGRTLHRYVVAAGAIAAVLSCAGLASAQASIDDLKRLSLAELGNIVVTATSKTPEELLTSPAAAFVLTADDIQRSGATSLPELLRTVPGVEVARIDSDHWSVGIRGFGDEFSKSVLVLIDGRNVYTPLFAGIMWGVQDVVLQDVERIEVIRGPGATVWGANAVNGVINIVTKSAHDTQGTLASVQAGGVDHAVGEVRYGGAIGANLAYRVYAKGFDRGPEVHTDGTTFDAWRMAQSGFRMDWSRDADSLTVQGDIYSSRQGQSVAFASFEPPKDVVSLDPLHLGGGNLLANWSRTLTPHSDIQLRVYYDRTTLLGPQAGETRNTLDVDFVHHLGLPRQDIRWGAGLHRSPSTYTDVVPSLVLNPVHETDSISSAFVQDEIALVPDRVSLTAGVKVEHNNFTGAETQPSVRALWRPTRRQSLWGAVTRAVRTPSQLEEDVTLDRFLTASPLTYLEIQGRSTFEAERVLGYEGGYRIAMGDRAFLDVAAFHNRHDDLQGFGAASFGVATSPAPPHFVFILPYANADAGTSSGVEIAPDWKATPWLQLKGSYSYLHVDIHNATTVEDVLDTVGTYNGSSPRHQAVVQPILTVSPRWEIDQTYRYVSALPARDVPAYTTLDARAAWHATPSLDIALIGQNLLQDDHVEFGHNPGPNVAIARTAAVSVTWHR